MPTTQTKLGWEKVAEEKYLAMVGKIPIFHRELVKQVVPKRAEQNAVDRRASQIEEGDIIKAFTTEVPKAFYSLMIRLMDEVKFDYKKFK